LKEGSSLPDISTVTGKCFLDMLGVPAPSLDRELFSSTDPGIELTAYRAERW
jgi:hypothetical protein